MGEIGLEAPQYEIIELNYLCYPQLAVAKSQTMPFNHKQKQQSHKPQKHGHNMTPISYIVIFFTLICRKQCLQYSQRILFSYETSCKFSVSYPCPSSFPYLGFKNMSRCLI